MNATAIAVPVTGGQSLTRAIRVALVTMAIVVICAVSFVVGRATVSTAQRVPAIAPAADVPASTASCHLGRPC